MTTPTQGEHAQTEALKHAEGLEWFAERAPGFGLDPLPLKNTAAFIRRLYAQVAALTAAPSVSDGERALHEAILNRLSHPELLEKAHYLMELNSNQARTIGELQDLVAAQPAAPQGVAYAELPAKIEPCEVRAKLDPTANPDEYALCVGADMWNACIAAAHALRASNGQAPAGAKSARHYGPLRDADAEYGKPLSVYAPTAQAAPAAGVVAGPTSAHIAAMERAWLWMDNQADSQSKGGHATFDLLMLREERDALRAAIDMEVTATCPHCNGAGEVFGHAENCTDDLCALNGDEHSCAGQVEPCQCAAAPTPAAQAADSVLAECGNCFEGKSDFDHVCKHCGGSGKVADSVLEDAALLHYALADGGNQSMNWQDVYDDWNGEGYFIDALRAAYKQDAARKQGGKHD